jgi:hypothetical protein
MADPMAD